MCVLREGGEGVAGRGGEGAGESIFYAQNPATHRDKPYMDMISFI